MKLQVRNPSVCERKLSNRDFRVEGEVALCVRISWVCLLFGALLCALLRLSSIAAGHMGDESIKEEAMDILGKFNPLPRLIVFDLDYTIWPFYCVYRSKQEMPHLYPHAQGILEALKDKGISIAIASRAFPGIANTFLDKLGLSSLFVAKEIFSSRSDKTEHFQKINRETRVPYEEMLFFDDEARNIDSVSEIGVTSILVKEGVNLVSFKQGLSEFAKNSTADKKS